MERSGIRGSKAVHTSSIPRISSEATDSTPASRLNPLPGHENDGPTASVPIDRIHLNPYQPRKTFDGDELATLSASIREHGVLQPVVVRQSGDEYQLIAGERRLRAAQQAGLSDI